MIKNYFKVAIRSLMRNRTHTFINIVGLTIGVACCMLIALFVYDEITFDRFHSKGDRIYRVFGREDWGKNQEFFYTVTPFPMGPTLKENFPEIESQVRITNVGAQVRIGDNVFNEPLTVAGLDFFMMFDFELVHGRKEDVFAQQNSIVLSVPMAGRFFGDADPVGRTLSIQLTPEGFEDFVVSAVAKVPTNSSIQFGMLTSELQYPRLYSQQALTSGWFNTNPETYVLLQEGVRPAAVVEKFPALFRTILGNEEFEQSKYAPGLQPLRSIHLDPTFPVGIAPVNDPQYLYILSGVAVAILGVACINFITLSLGQSTRRAKEVGVRKVAGAARVHLISQFVGEAMVVTFLSLFAGFGLALLALPLFNELAGKQLFFEFNGIIIGVLVGLLLIIGVFAGSYPAFVLSSFRPIVVLKGIMHHATGKQTLRKVLVSVQLVLSVFLITSTVIMRNQLEFLQKKNLGFDKDQLLVIPLSDAGQGNFATRIERTFQRTAVFKGEFEKLSGVVGICAASHNFGSGSWTKIGFTDDLGIYRTFRLNVIDEDYLSVMNMEILEGRLITQNPSDLRRGVVVNEAFVNMFGWTDITGKRIPGKAFEDHEIIGVVRDFHYASLHTAVEPLVMVANLRIILAGTENVDIASSPVPKLFLKLHGEAIGETLEEIGATWKGITGGEEFAFDFVDASLKRQYADDQNLQRVVTVATVLAVIIGCLGLYSLASLAMQGRAREVSVRKVFGATERSLVMLLSREYVLLVLVSIALSMPLSVLWVNKWLSGFAYRVEVGVPEYLFAATLAMLVTLVTISFQTLRTAWTKPAETLKYE